MDRLATARRMRDERTNHGRRQTLEKLEAEIGLASRTILRVFDGREPVDRRSLEIVFAFFGLTLAARDFRYHNGRQRTFGKDVQAIDAATTFIGRRDDLDRLAAHVSLNRCVTLVGAGGIGKTRLAARAAREAGDEYPDGVWVVEPSREAEPAALLPLIARVFGLEDAPGVPATSLVARFLRERRGLLILDGCERLVAACAALCSDLLPMCPGIHVLATSREPLRIVGETVFAVRGLKLPPLDCGYESAPAREYDSVALFLERAREHGYPPIQSAADLETVAEIVRALEGSPASIEFAAARLEVIPLAGLRDRVAPSGGRCDVPRFTTSNSDGVGPSSFAYAELTNGEIAVLATIAAFAGGISREAAASATLHIGCSETELARTLVHLERKAFVSRTKEILNDRFVIDDATAEYVGRRTDPDVLQAIRRAHALHFASTVRAAEPLALDAAFRRRVDFEADNIERALQWSLADGQDVVTGIEIVLGMAEAWLEFGHWSRARRWLGAALCREGDIPDPTTAARLQFWLAATAAAQFDFVAAHSAIWRALAGFDRSNDIGGFADALEILWLIRNRSSDRTSVRGLAEHSTFAEAMRAMTPEWLNQVALGARLHLDERGSEALVLAALQLHEKAGATHGMAMACQNLAAISLALDSDVRRARLLCDRASALCDPRAARDVARLDAMFGEVAAVEGDLDRAESHMKAALAAYDAFGHRPYRIEMLCRLGALDVRRGRYGTAAGVYERALDSALELEYEAGIRSAVDAFAQIAVLRGDWHRGLRLYGFGTTVRPPGRPEDLRSHRRRHAAYKRGAAKEVGPECYARELRSGRRLTRRELVAEVEAVDAGRFRHPL